MFTLLISLIVLFSVLLIILILVQNPKGGGISGEFGSAGATQMFGVQKTGDLVEQLSLIKPEKSLYFATQILELKNKLTK